MTGRDTFDRIADIYDRVRPGYSPEITDKILQYSGAGLGVPVLEIGAGSGQLTRAFVMDHPVTCVEPGEAFCRLLRQNFPGVAVVNSIFEEFQGEAGSWGLVVSGTAFHWVDPGIGYPLIHRLLRPGGSLALVWHRYDVTRDTPLERDITAIYQDYAAALEKTDQARGILSTEKDTRYWLTESGLYRDYEHVEHEFTIPMRADAFMHLTATHSSHQLLDQDSREALLSRIRDAITRHGGIYYKTIRSVMELARKAD